MSNSYSHEFLCNVCANMCHLLLFTSAKEVMFGLSVYRQDYAKNCQADFHDNWWRGVAWAQEEPITLWSRSRPTNDSSLSSTLQERPFGLGGGLHSPSALLV